MCDEYDRRGMGVSNKPEPEYTNLMRDNQILKRAVLIMDERLKVQNKVEHKLKLELMSKD